MALHRFVKKKMTADIALRLGPSYVKFNWIEHKHWTVEYPVDYIDIKNSKTHAVHFHQYSKATKFAAKEKAKACLALKGCPAEMISKVDKLEDRKGGNGGYEDIYYKIILDKK